MSSDLELGSIGSPQAEPQEIEVVSDITQLDENIPRTIFSLTPTFISACVRR